MPGMENSMDVDKSVVIAKSVGLEVEEGVKDINGNEKSTT